MSYAPKEFDYLTVLSMKKKASMNYNCSQSSVDKINVCIIGGCSYSTENRSHTCVAALVSKVQYIILSPYSEDWHYTTKHYYYGIKIPAVWPCKYSQKQ